jgi:hypothetical protein
VKPLCAGIFAEYAEDMTPPTHLSSIRELREIRRERPRLAGETEDTYFQRVAIELRRRQRTQHGGLIRRVLRREARR